MRAGREGRKKGGRTEQCRVLVVTSTERRAAGQSGVQGRSQPASHKLRPPTSTACQQQSCCHNQAASKPLQPATPQGALTRRLSFLFCELRRMKYFCAWLATCSGRQRGGGGKEGSGCRQKWARVVVGRKMGPRTLSVRVTLVSGTPPVFVTT